MGPWWEQEEPEPFAMYAQQGQSVSPDQMLPAGHPSNILRAIRGYIPEVQADDASLASGITSRIGRTLTGIPRAGLETMANWLQGTHDPNAVRIGPDTAAPLGLFSMGTGVLNAGLRTSRAQHMANTLERQHPDEIAGGSMVRQRIAGHDRIGVSGEDGMTSMSRANMHTPSDAVTRAPAMPLPANFNAAMADNAKSSVPGTVVNAMAEAGVSRGRTVADDLLGIGTDADRFQPAFEALKADKSLSKADWDELANRFQNAPTNSAFQYKFKNIAEAQKFIWEAFIRRHSAETRRASIERLTKWPGQDGAQASPTASSPGLAANSTQQEPDAATLAILRQYGFVP